MTWKWIGAILVVVGCGGFGFSLASAHRRELQLLRRYRRCLIYMYNELKYRMTPLPELCMQTAQETGGVLRQVFRAFADTMEVRNLPDPGSCMVQVLKTFREPLPASLRKLLMRLGRSLGKFDLTGQLRSMDAMITACEDEITLLNANKDIRLRNYQTLGICTGLALVILFV